jgi:hypothetical protein
MKRYLRIAGGLLLLVIFSSSVFFILSSKETEVKVIPSIDKKNSKSVSLSISDNRFLVKIEGKRVKSLFVPAIGEAEVSIQSRKNETLLLNGTANKVLMNKKNLSFLNFKGEGCNGKLKVNIRKLILKNGNFLMGDYQLKGDKILIFGKRTLPVNFEKLCRSPEEWIKKGILYQTE